jgi:hypothetical protein
MPALPRRETILLVLILASSWALRIVLVWSGGQHYFPDEGRYNRAQFVLDAFARGDTGPAIWVLNQPDHPLFVVIGLIPAAAERVAGSSTRIPAAFFASFSVASLYLLWILVGRLGGCERVRLISTLLFALSTTNLYYARHLVPYDAALTLGLAALVAGFRSPVRVRDSVVCGALASASTLTYNGYWILAGFALLAHALRPPSSASSLLRRGLIAGSAFAAPIALFLGTDAAFGGDLAHRMAAFSKTVVQGDFAEGWKLPLAYFWHAEHGIAVLGTVAIVWATARLIRGGGGETLRLGLAGIGFIYGGLVMMSVVLRRMVVYGRLARPIVPFVCILTALMLVSLAQRSKTWRTVAAVILGGAGIQAAVNFAAPLAQMFPPEFRALAARTPTPGNGGTRRLLYTEYIYPAPTPPPPDCDRIVIARRHPLQFLPYQYEGYTPEERAKLRATDIRMRLVLCSGSPGGTM